MAKKKTDMFFDLKRKFVFNSVAMSTVVIVAAFVSIYIIVSVDLGNRKPGSENFEFQSSQEKSESTSENSSSSESQSLKKRVKDYLDDHMEEERTAALNTLLSTLIITGLALDLIILLFSIYQAEQSVRPVREAYESQRAFIANASHEIKTPLAVIQANLEAADIQDNRWIDNAQKKVDDLTALNNQLLSLARMDSLTPSAELETIDFGKTVSETADFYLPQIREKKAKLDIKIPKKPVNKKLNRAAFIQIINILIDNAVKYSKSKIDIIVSSNSVKITNDGTTINKSDLEHIFDRFYQTDKTSNGVGLGLSIAKTIAKTNHWKLSANSDEKTTTFTLIV